MDKKYADIALNLPLDSLFTYGIPGYLKGEVEIGKRAIVNFAGKAMTGIVVRFAETPPVKNVKDIKTILDDKRIITDELIKFCQWV